MDKDIGINMYTRDLNLIYNNCLHTLIIDTGSKQNITVVNHLVAQHYKIHLSSFEDKVFLNYF